ncbi:FAD-dependent oxidoreductase [Flammeovirga sp. EKP202]|uniref:FAD-dependent oxidoreductase n=1 Tax=Flammeovirga sp. EKP202 TaxID=2770592 RepID=UPI00165FFDC3|nr:FAD-dependent oxidoreductase [Flammeovirga sp. EKP202]MBD0402015.1 FAD-dependent oxidoreductase [Flammeovirga sp. EKP202]
MIQESYNKNRSLKEVAIDTDLLIVGGGLSGTCAAITAARQGVKVVLVQDRPILGGNASSEVRLWALGATSHMGNNNRWSRETGVTGEILEENLYRNREGNALIFDTILIEKVKQEENITLLLNTSAFEVTHEDTKIQSVKAFNSQNSTLYNLSAKRFCDASGDGVLSFLAGASFRMGAETIEEFGEKMAPNVEQYGELLGHTIYFYTKNTDKPVKFTPPAYALKDIEELPRFKNIQADHTGCNYWWIEYGGRLDTIHETENIKYELWKVVYGIWNYIKNSGKFPEAENMTLEWVGTVPGKRESRRFEGLYMMKQQDIIEQRRFDDAIAHGGWALDLHPSDGVYSSLPSCTQWHSKGTYQIPLRTAISRDIDNLFFAGRIVSVSHVAFGSTRVMLTSAVAAEGVAVAAAYSIQNDVLPYETIEKEHIEKIQQKLLEKSSYIPHVKLDKSGFISSKANVSVSSELNLTELRSSNIWKTLEMPSAQMLPITRDQQTLSLRVPVIAAKETTVDVELKASLEATNFTPEKVIGIQSTEVEAGRHFVDLKFDVSALGDTYVFVCFAPNADLQLNYSEDRITGILSVFRKENKAVSNFGQQEPPKEIGIDGFEFWTPQRRPEGQNIAMQLKTPLFIGKKENLESGVTRPVQSTNAWIAALDDAYPTLTLEWEEVQEISSIKLFFDADLDHAMESTQFGHPESIVPYCVESFRIKDETGKCLFQTVSNHTTLCDVKLDQPVKTSKLVIELDRKDSRIPVALFDVICN